MKITQLIIQQIVELGTVTHLTLGTGIHGFESRYTPVGVFIKNKQHVTHVVELGKATNLTMGGGHVNWEIARPRYRIF